jgi:RNA polymerase sigma-70 factor (ECF subfamily)
MIMEHSHYPEIESNYRALYGKLFSALIGQFGTSYVNAIEDAIQNTFLKSLRLWKLNKAPDKTENWLFVVARNDVLNQIRAKQRVQDHPVFVDTITTREPAGKDLRLEVILLISSAKDISNQAKVLFILKNIFGLKVEEISSSTLIRSEAIYKAINRAKTSLKKEFGDEPSPVFSSQPTESQLSTVEDILYAVFTIGFDSFDPNIQSIVNEDLCLEAMALARLLHITFRADTTKNLLALFCFHSARIPAKVADGKLVSFFNQDRKKWDGDLINAGFHYLTKPEQLHRYYLEALIASKYLTLDVPDKDDWNEINDLYELLLLYHHSPIVKLNQCYALSRADRNDEALCLLEEIKHEFQGKHLYFSVVKAELLRLTHPHESEKVLDATIQGLEQTMRKEFLMESKLFTP